MRRLPFGTPNNFNFSERIFLEFSAEMSKFFTDLAPLLQIQFFFKKKKKFISTPMVFFVDFLIKNFPKKKVKLAPIIQRIKFQEIQTRADQEKKKIEPIFYSCFIPPLIDRGELESVKIDLKNPRKFLEFFLCMIEPCHLSNEQLLKMK